MNIFHNKRSNLEYNDYNWIFLNDSLMFNHQYDGSIYSNNIFANHMDMDTQSHSEHHETSGNIDNSAASVVAQSHPESEDSIEHQVDENEHSESNAPSMEADGEQLNIAEDYDSIVPNAYNPANMLSDEAFSNSMLLGASPSFLVDVNAAFASTNLIATFEPRQLLSTLDLIEAQLNFVRQTVFGLPSLGSNLFTNDFIEWKGHVIGQPITLTYTYDVNSWVGGHEYIFPTLQPWDQLTLSALNQSQKAMVNASMALWSNVANINFVRIDTPITAGFLFMDPVLGAPILLGPTAPLVPDIVIRDVEGSNIPFLGTSTDLFTATTLNPGPFPSAIWGGQARAEANDIIVQYSKEYVAGSIAAGSGRVTVHELGHALGFKHGGPYGGTESFPPYVTPELDNKAATIMAYDLGYVDGVYVTALTPMVLDIMTAQYLYGANHNFNAGDNVYMFDGIKFTPTAGIMDGYTLWDGGGLDTINSTSYLYDVKIDLGEGLDHYSHIGDQIIWLAAPISFFGQIQPGSVGANIENAVSGGGNDIIYGNALDNILSGNNGSDQIFGEAGNDQLFGGNGIDTLVGGAGNDKLFGENGDDFLAGGLGNDQLTGGNGNDTFTFQRGGGNDVVMDFGKGNDILQLVGLTANDVVNISHTGGNTAIDFGQGDVITLENSILDSLLVNNVIFT